MSLRSLCAVPVVIACLASAANAQDQGASVSGGVSAFNLDSNTSIAYTGAFDFRFNHVVALEVELTWAPSLRTNVDGVSITPDVTSLLSPIIGPIVPRISNAGGRAAILSNNVRVAIPTTTTRVEPFFVAGGGVAGVRKTVDFTYTLPPLFGLVTPIQRGTTQQVTLSSLGMALTIGGGVGFEVTPHLWVDADLRLVRILAEQDRNAGRFGVAARYRF